MWNKTSMETIIPLYLWYPNFSGIVLLIFYNLLIIITFYF